MNDEQFNTLMTAARADLELGSPGKPGGPGRVHRLIIEPLLDEAQAMRDRRNSITEQIISATLGDSWCMDNADDKSNAVALLYLMFGGNEATEAGDDEADEKYQEVPFGGRP